MSIEHPTPRPTKARKVALARSVRANLSRIIDLTQPHMQDTFPHWRELEDAALGNASAEMVELIDLINAERPDRQAE